MLARAPGTLVGPVVGGGGADAAAGALGVGATDALEYPGVVARTGEGYIPALLHHQQSVPIAVRVKRKPSAMILRVNPE